MTHLGSEHLAPFAQSEVYREMRLIGRSVKGRLTVGLGSRYLPSVSCRQESCWVGAGLGPMGARARRRLVDVKAGESRLPGPRGEDAGASTHSWTGSNLPILLLCFLFSFWMDSTTSTHPGREGLLYLIY